MALRPSLLAPAVDPKLHGRLVELAAEAERLVDDDEDCDAVLAEIQTLTGESGYGRAFFEMMPGCSSPKEFADRAALGIAPYVADITREELIDTIRLLDLELDAGNVARSDYYVDLFRRNVTHPGGSDLIYHPRLFWPEGYQPTAEEIVDRAIDPNNIIKL